jgi:hypothetical protein
VDVLETTEDLIEKVADVVVAEPLCLEQLVKVSLHETLDNVNILHGVNAGCSENVSDVDNILMIEPGQDLDLSQGSLTIGLMLKRTDFLDRNLQLKELK